MKTTSLKSLICVLIFSAGLTSMSCKSKTKNTDNTTTASPVDSTSSMIDTATTIQVSPDATLQKGVEDAVKDYPDVKATVENGEITLTGDISRDRLPKLMMALNSLHPKKINNNLTVK